MNRAEFLTQLRGQLKPLPQSEIEKTISFYIEAINDRMEDGMSEEEAVASLETPDAIAREILVENATFGSLVRARVQEGKEQKQQQKQGQRGQGKSDSAVGWALLITLLVLGLPLWLPLLLALAAVLLSIYVVIWALVISVFAVLFALGSSAVCCLVAFFFAFPYSGLAALL